ncbi:hypothetical protein GCM10023091_31870 [Ravibacter arvi]|uniref:Photosynthesis system II assembly factor Ycf48/Hcf136-like domain-containing protein n=1 Tax=Ravibacter arvi TaxID=2051041 RepID=A0ABP8M5S3_9BACT
MACKKENATPVEEPVFSTFQEMETDLPYQYYLQAWCMNDSTGLVVGAKGAVMKTVNGGKNWVRIDSHTDFTLYDIRFMNGNVGYILGYNEEEKGIILRTGDAGNSWGIFRQFDGMKGAAISFPDAKTGYILLDEKRLLKTLDSGATWSEITVNIESANKMGFHDPLYGFITSADGFYYETLDGGHTWNRFKEPTSEDLQQIYFQGDEVVLKSDTRLYYKSLSSNRNSDVLPIPSSGVLEFTNDGKGVAVGGRTGPNGLKPTTYVYATIDQFKTWPEKRPDAGIMTLSKLGTNKFLMIGNRSGRALIFTMEL